MLVTIVAAVIVMVAYFLLLYGMVAFVQDKRFMSTAPKENLAVIPDRKERFRGAHAVGWCIEVVALLVFIGAIVLSVWDGVRHDFGYWKFFARFIVIMYVMEIYDIGFFDWVLLCHSNFFPRYYPEVKGVVGPHMFGYNMKMHVMHFIIYIPICAVVAGVCMLF